MIHTLGWRLVLLASSTLLLASCGESNDGPEPVHPVRGQVLFQGKPLADARVVFHPVDAPKDDNKPRPTAQTDADGKFELHTYVGNDGAAVGDYLVSISVAPTPTENRDLMANAVTKGTAKAPKDPIQYRYFYPDRSGLKAKVVAGENVLLPFELK